MKTFEDVQAFTETLTANLTASAELHANYFSSTSTRLAESVTSMVENTTSHIATILKSDSFISAHESRAAFETQLLSTIANLAKANTTASNALIKDVAAVYGLDKTEAAANDKPVKTTAKKATPSKANAA
ncbi:MAG: hypothetical protein ACI9BO_000984 [Zhongshania sp.]|jgi:hypothetical protein